MASGSTDQVPDTADSDSENSMQQTDAKVSLFIFFVPQTIVFFQQSVPVYCRSTTLEWVIENLSCSASFEITTKFSTFMSEPCASSHKELCLLWWQTKVTSDLRPSIASLNQDSWQSCAEQADNTKSIPREKSLFWGWTFIREVASQKSFLCRRNHHQRVFLRVHQTCEFAPSGLHLRPLMWYLVSLLFLN